jgi:hypothetical protein
LAETCSDSGFSREVDQIWTLLGCYAACGGNSLQTFRDKHINPVLIMKIYLTAIGLTPGGSSTVHIYTQTVHRLTPGGSSTVHIYTQTVQQASTHLHTNSTAGQYTFTHKQYSRTVHIYTQTVQQYSTHLHTNSTAGQYTFTHKQYTEYTERNIHNNKKEFG